MSLGSALPVITTSSPQSASPAPARALGREVLVVDDDGGVRLLAVRWLERSGLRAREAENGADALRMLSAEPDAFGAVILDVMMPNMNGYEVLERMQANERLRDVPVVILSAHVEQESAVVEGLRRGAVDHVSKPFRGPILAAKVQAIVERRGRVLELEERLRRALAQATTDAMTGLGNRRQFEADLEREKAYTARHRTPLSLILVDIDNLKVINDAFGHSSGDRAIAWTAEGLRSSLRSSDRGFRIGGDEFAVLMRGLDGQRGQRAARRFLETQTKQPLVLDEADSVRVTVSVGVAAADAANDYDVRELFNRADRALYQAKSQKA
jgi:diguanylate cyclase (GGDEF)-like protein